MEWQLDRYLNELPDPDPWEGDERIQQEIEAGEVPEAEDYEL